MQLVNEGYVSGWDDPRMPTLSGLRRRGYTPESIRNFCERIGVAKRQTTVDMSLLEHCIREDLNKNAERALGVLRPLRVIIDNYPEGTEEELEALNNPEDPESGKHSVWFSREIYIERDDFMENPPPKFYRLSPGTEVRLRYGYLVRCTGIEKDENTGEIIAVHCSYDPDTRGGHAPDGRKVRGTIHWVSAAHSMDAEIRLYDHLFSEEKPDDFDDFLSTLNENSLEILTDCKVEKRLSDAMPWSRYQFERLGYFNVDTDNSRLGHMVFNRIVPLRDTWAKISATRATSR